MEQRAHYRSTSWWPALGRAALAVLVLLLSTLGPAAAAGVQVTGVRWGVTGYLNSLRELNQAQTLGITDLRYAVRWSDVQPTGPSDWNWTGIDAVAAGLQSSGGRVWMMVNSGSAAWAVDTSGLATSDAATADCPPLVLPTLDEPITGTEPYYVFVENLVTRYHDVVDAWLIDNEPSESWSWAGDADSYARMARVAAAAAHAADPTAVVALGAIPADTVTFMVIADRLDDPTQQSWIVSYASRMWGLPVTVDLLNYLFSNPAYGLWERVNFYRQALAVLPQMNAQAGNVLGQVARGQLANDLVWSYQDQMAAYGGLLRPLIYTELNPYLEGSLTSAQETTKLMIGTLATGAVRGQSYLEFADGSVMDAADPYCGLVTAAGLPKTGYYAYQTIISQIGRRDFAGGLSLPPPLTGYWFQSTGGQTVYAIWAPSSVTANLSAYLSLRKITLISMTGSATTVMSSAVPVGPSPCYLIVPSSLTKKPPIRTGALLRQR